jgi:hypothetical protein
MAAAEAMPPNPFATLFQPQEAMPPAPFAAPPPQQQQQQQQQAAAGGFTLSQLAAALNTNAPHAGARAPRVAQGMPAAAAAAPRPTFVRPPVIRW